MKHRKIFAPLLVAFLMAGLCPAAELAIDVPEQSEPYTLIDARATAGMNGYLWILTRPDGKESSQIRKTGPDGDMICFTGPPGKLKLECIATTAKCKPLRAVAYPVIGEAPDPDPFPSPDVASVIVVIESESQAPWASVIVSRTWRTYLENRKVAYRVVDPDVTNEAGSVPSGLKRVFRASESTDGPDVCFSDGDGDVTCKPLPKTSDALMDILKQAVP